MKGIPSPAGKGQQETVAQSLAVHADGDFVNGAHGINV
jgi:hypothetical protein